MKYSYDGYDLISFVVVDLEIIKPTRDYCHVVCIVSPNNELYAGRRRGQSLLLSGSSRIVTAAATWTWRRDNKAADI